MLLEKICEALGVEVGEEWTGVGVHHNPPKYKIKDNTLWIYHRFNFEEDYSWVEASMADYVSLIKGEIKPQWIPKDKEKYYMPQPTHKEERHRFMKFTFSKHSYDQWAYKNNLVFKTKEEAIKAANKMLETLKEEYK